MAYTWQQLDSEQQANALLVARAAKAGFGDLGRQVVVNMVAIAGAESGFRTDTAGDHYSVLSGNNRKLCLQMNCGGYCSHGFWQVFAAVHRQMLVNLGAPDPMVDPCGTAEWLYQVSNCAVASREIYRWQGYGAWTVYGTGAYRDWLDVAEYAVTAIEEQPPVEPPAEPGSWLRGIYAVILALAVYLAAKGR